MKTAWAALWFAVLGGGLLLTARMMGWWEDPAPVERDSRALAGALPMASTVSHSAGATTGSRSRTSDREDLTDYTVVEVTQSIEGPEDGGMCGFYQKLLGLDRGEATQPVRVLHYGDSILTTDELSGTIRRRLQRRFGDGGHGFVLLGKPWRWYHHLDVVHGARGKWRARPLTSDPISDGLYGLGGVAFETTKRSARAWAGTVDEGAIGTKVATFDISYLEQPRGGSIELIVNGEPAGEIATEGPERRAAHHLLRVPQGRATLEVKTRGDGPVRLFGVVMESGEPGVVYDSLAINGARASVLGRFDQAHWRKEIARRSPDLVLLMFGANEGHNEWLVLPEYRKHLAEVIRSVRGAIGDGVCLVAGPLDQARRLGDGTMTSRRMPAKLCRAQREVALAEGCGFFDTLAAMGGEESMARWYRRGWGGGDLVHPTEHGARQIGRWITEALLGGYERFRLSGNSCPSADEEIVAGGATSPSRSPSAPAR